MITSIGHPNSPPSVGMGQPKNDEQIARKGPPSFSRGSEMQSAKRGDAPDGQFRAFRNAVTNVFFRRSAPQAAPEPQAVSAFPGQPPLSPELNRQIDEAYALLKAPPAMEAGASMLIYVNNELMMLRHTLSGDGYVLQTPELSQSKPFSGLYFSKTPTGANTLKMNLEDVTPESHNNYEMARYQLAGLVAALKS
jgi:hypothetical protein